LILSFSVSSCDRMGSDQDFQEWMKVDRECGPARIEGARRSTSHGPQICAGDAQTATRKSFRTTCDEGCSDMRRTVANRKSYNLGCDEGNARGSIPGKMEKGLAYAGDQRRSTSISRRSFERATTDEGESVVVSDESDADTEVFVTEDESWRKVSEVFGRDRSDLRQSISPRLSQSASRDWGGNVRQSIASRKSQSQRRDDEGDVRRSTVGRASQAQYLDDQGAVASDVRGSLARRSEYPTEGDVRSSFARQSLQSAEGEMPGSIAVRYSQDFGSPVQEGDARQSVSARKSQSASRDSEGDLRRGSRRSEFQGDSRQSIAARKSQNFSNDDAGDLRRSTVGRASHAQYLDDQGEPRQSISVRKSQSASRDTEGDLRGSRQSQFQGPRGSRSSRLIEGSEQRMLSQPPVPEPESSESEIFTGAGRDGFQRKSEVAIPPRPAELTLVLDADDIDQMKSIVWKFTQQGASVKVMGQNCPKAEPEDLRAGDILMFINEEFVLDKDKQTIQRMWKDEQLENQYLRLRFRAC